jgi:diguanylate cyclase (GGDEF)-like protein
MKYFLQWEKLSDSSIALEERIFLVCLPLTLCMSLSTFFVDVFNQFLPGMIINSVLFIVVSVLVVLCRTNKYPLFFLSTAYVVLVMAAVLAVYSHSEYLVSELMFVICAPIVAAMLTPKNIFICVCLLYYGLFSVINLTAIANIPLPTPYLVQILVLHTCVLIFFKFYVDENKILRVKLEQSYQDIKMESITDPLTTLFSRKEFHTQMRTKIDQFKRDTRPFVLAIIDVDLFKNVNDTFGHLQGDKTLMQLAKRIKSSVREVDKVFRFGGEEFVVLFHDTNSSQIKKTVEKVVAVAGGVAIIPNHRVTISVGYSQSVENDSYDSLIHRADEALYHVKNNGRNGSHTFDPVAQQ